MRRIGLGIAGASLVMMVLMFIGRSVWSAPPVEVSGMPVYFRDAYGNPIRAVDPVTGGVKVDPVSANRCVSQQGALGAALTVTLPAGGANTYQEITGIRIDKSSVVPVNVTIAGLPGSPIFATDMGLGTGKPTHETLEVNPPHDFTAAAANTVVTFTCPATPGIVWTLTVWYHLGEGL